MRRRALFVGLGVVWGTALVFGMSWAMNYGNAEGKPGEPRDQVQTDQRKPFHCVMVLHPQCPCSESSVKALREAAARNGTRMSFSIVFAGERPSTPSRSMKLATEVSGASVSWVTAEKADEEFGAFTSGQVFVYRSTGQLVFSGGITPGRGVDQPTYARDLFGLIVDDAKDSAPVYGCPIQDVVQ